MDVMTSMIRGGGREDGFWKRSVNLLMRDAITEITEGGLMFWVEGGSNESILMWKNPLAPSLQTAVDKW